MMNDFLTTYPVQEVTKQDAITYVSLLISMAEIDGMDQDESDAIKLLIENNKWEKDVYDLALAKGNVSIESLNLSQDFIEVVGPYVIRDLLVIAYISNGFSNAENEHVQLISQKFGVSQENYIRIKQAINSQYEAISNWSHAISI
jgi:hypothetical protein